VEKTIKNKAKKTVKNKHFRLLTSLFFLLALVFYFFPTFLSSSVSYQQGIEEIFEKIEEKISGIPLDKEAYDKKLIEVANNPPLKELVPDPKTGIVATPKPNLWPVKTEYPNSGAILPFKRVIAYYGNLYSKKMGALGEYPEEEMFRRLNEEVKKWNVADPGTEAIPALHYIAVVAQGSAGKDGKYRFRMPDAEIEKVLKMAEKIKAIVFLDIQVALSDLESEVPYLEKYLKLPNVHLGVDPEFAMQNGTKPGKAIGTFDAKDINFTSSYLAKLIKENNLPPKIFVVHRFTQGMVTNYKQIKTLPEVQLVMHMDGWGPKAKKINTYKQFIYKEPVQFTGFKIFYKNDLRDPGTTLFVPEELLKLNPKPLYIQYQ
jgi:hypothetical protein